MRAPGMAPLMYCRSFFGARQWQHSIERVHDEIAAMRHLISCKGALIVSACLLTEGALAQQTESSTLRVIVAFGAGGYTDTVARITAEGLSRRLGKQVIVENRTGANGNIGTAAVAKSAPDGNTLLMANDGNFVINPHIFSKMPYNALEDFAPVSNVSATPYLLVANPSVPANDVREFIAYAKTKPGTIFYASPGAGTMAHLAGESLKQTAAIQMDHIPYKGGSLAINDVVGGRVPILFGSTSTALPFVKSGRLKVLGISSARRSGLWPDVPTFVENGLPDFVFNTWNGIVAPAGTPKPVIDRLQKEIAAVLQEPAVRERFDSLGYESIGNTPEQFREQIRADFTKWAKVVQQANIRPLD
ncbi:MAG: tripartite tricarboxylate transporter substrate binding protein [Betaproteobacteria bacterium]|nr:tripartite tricarboxylate transporter substrate binding protein [Betaproteobacteria bacterium]